MPVGTLSTAAAAAVQSNTYTGALKVTVTLPVVGTLDLSANVVNCNFSENDTSSYPDDLTDKAGLMNMAGSVDLSGTAVVSGSVVSMIRLFNPDDPASPLFGHQVTNSPITVSLGVLVNGAAAAEYVDRPAYVTTTETDVEGGVVTVDFSDEPPGWDNLSAVNAVLTAPPYNAGLTSEFVIDRIARAASNYAVSSWPTQRPNCALAVGMRTSVWPELGTLSAFQTPFAPSFSTGVFGSALSAASPDPIYSLSSSISASDVTLEFWSAVSTGTGTGKITISNGIGPGTSSFQVILGAGTAIQVQVVDNVGNAYAFSGPTLTTGNHYIGVHVHWASGSWSTDIRLDATTTSSGTQTHTLNFPGSFNQAEITLPSGAGLTVEAFQVSSEASPAWNNTFTPLLSCDTSLNTLQAVPAIDAGTDAYTELQTVAEAEGGYLGFRSGVLTFLNRETIAGQSASRTVTAASSFKGLQQAQTGAYQVFNDVEIDYTEYTYSTSGGNVSNVMVFTPPKAWKVPAHTTQTWTKTLPNSLTVGQVDGSITYRTTQAGTPGATNSVLRASIDINGVTEVNDTTAVYGTVTAVTASQIQITVTNASSADVWLVSPSNYTDVNAGTPALWISGVTVTPDSTANLIHVNDPLVTATNTYTAPTNQYRQDRDSATATAQWLLNQLWSPKVMYGSVDIVPDPRVTAADRVTLDVPVDGGVTSLDVFVWGVSFSASLEPGQEVWDMTLDVRAAGAPGEWVLGTSVLGTNTLVY